MHISSAHIKSFKRFTDLRIVDIPPTAQLVVLVGPNGVGKSSVFDAFRLWHSHFDGRGLHYDQNYHLKVGAPVLNHGQHVELTFHEALPERQDLKKVFYFRSAYRNEADFITRSLERAGDDLDSPRVSKMIDNEATVSDNYKRIVSRAVDGLFGGTHDAQLVADLREDLIGNIRTSLRRIFDDLQLDGPGDPLKDGTFFFDKGTSKRFYYKNLSGGEKAAFDLILDLTLKLKAFDDTVFCIDEPETHMHTRLQARLLEELVSLTPATSQLWVSTHSIGMMRKAKELAEADPGRVVFLNFGMDNFDEAAVLSPQVVDREFWTKTLSVALDDLANLVAPRRVVLCEGKPVADADSARAEFDARCFRSIFAQEFADTDFVSVGNERDVRRDSIGIGKAIQTVVAGTQIVRVVDRDSRSDAEIAELQAAGVRVLSRRNIESYLMDDEVLTALCQVNGRIESINDVLADRDAALASSVARGNPPDDYKSAAGQFLTAVRRRLGLTQGGNTVDAFLRDTMAPLIKASMAVYQELRRDVFGG